MTGRGAPRAATGRAVAGLALAAATGAALLAGAAAYPAGAHPDRGARVFQRCFACHSVAAGEDHLQGPNLRGVVGRRAGALPGFRYSPAMRRAGERGLTWDRAALEAFLADPEAVVPGTDMAIPGLRSAADRADIIDYLERAATRRVEPGGGDAYTR